MCYRSCPDRSPCATVQPDVHTVKGFCLKWPLYQRGILALSSASLSVAVDTGNSWQAPVTDSSQKHSTDMKCESPMQCADSLHLDATAAHQHTELVLLSQSGHEQFAQSPLWLSWLDAHAQVWAERQGLQAGQDALCTGLLLSMMAARQAFAGSLASFRPGIRPTLTPCFHSMIIDAAQHDLFCIDAWVCLH